MDQGFAIGNRMLTGMCKVGYEKPWLERVGFAGFGSRLASQAASGEE